MLKKTLSVDQKEFELPDTVFTFDIEDKVFHACVLRVLSSIEGISLLEGTLIDELLGREETERIKGIYVEQESEGRCVNIKVEINVAYGIPLLQKAEEIQNALTEQITLLTGLHVGRVHLVFKNIVDSITPHVLMRTSPYLGGALKTSEYSDEF